MQFNVVVDKIDTHTHFRFYVGDVSAGKLCMRTEEFLEFRSRGGVGAKFMYLVQLPKVFVDMEVKRLLSYFLKEQLMDDRKEYDVEEFMRSYSLSVQEAQALFAAVQDA